LCSLSTTAAIAGFASVKVATAERDLQFRALTFVQIGSQAASIGIMVLLAYVTRSLWALVIGNIIGTTITTFLGHAVLRGHRHVLRLDPHSVKSLVNFGRWVFFSTILAFLGGEGLRAIQGKLITPSEFGILAIAYTIAAIPIELSLKLTGTIGLPALAEVYRNDPDRLSEALYRFRSRTLALSLPLFALVAFSSNAIISILYDSRYHSAAPLVIILSACNAVALIFSGYSNALLAIGLSKTHFATSALTASLRIAGVLFGFYFHGLQGMLAGVGFANVIILFSFYYLSIEHNIISFRVDIAALIFIMFILFIVNL
jgi:O-antigen/teichoic acid export membrane protein